MAPGTRLSTVNYKASCSKGLSCSYFPPPPAVLDVWLYHIPTKSSGYLMWLKARVNTNPFCELHTSQNCTQVSQGKRVRIKTKHIAVTTHSSLTLLLVARKPTPSDFQHVIPITRDRTPVVTDLCCLLRLVLKTEECGKSTEGPIPNTLGIRKTEWQHYSG